MSSFVVIGQLHDQGNSAARCLCEYSSLAGACGVELVGFCMLLIGYEVN